MNPRALVIGVAAFGAVAAACSTGSGYQITTSGSSGGQTGGNTSSGTGTTGGTTGFPPECTVDAQCSGKMTDAGVSLSRCDAMGRCVECLASGDCGQGFCDVGSGTCLKNCVTNPQVCSAQQVCNPQTGGCVGCLSNTDCHLAAFPHCAASGSLQNRCVQCLSSSDCPLSAAGCNSISGSCGGCSGTGDCPPGLTCNGGICNCSPGDGGCGGDAPVCLAGVAGGTGFVCGCGESSQCPSSQVCDTLRFGNGACVAGCTSEMCAQTPPAIYCAPSGLCASCLDDNTCVDAGIGDEALPYCALAGFCGACRDDTQCTQSGLPHCFDYLGSCVQCTDFSQCPANEPGCDSRSHQCFRCHFSSDCDQDGGFSCDLGTHLCRASCAGTSCPAVQPYCENTTALCLQCQTDADCLADAGYRQPDAGPPPDGGDAGGAVHCNSHGFCGGFGEP
jgi:hypothetical protein